MSATNQSPISFDLPGFISECRPEMEQLRSVTPRSKQSFFFARYRHDKPNLGLLEPTPLADQIMVGVEMRPFSPINVFCDGQHKRRPSAGAGALAIYDLRKSWSADLRDPFDHICFYIQLNSFRDFAAERGSAFDTLRDDAEHVQYDSIMLHLMQAILPALDQPHQVSTLYLDSLFFAVRDHIASSYGVFSKMQTIKTRGLSSRQLRLAVEFIESAVCEDLCLQTIAEASATSVTSLVRGFKAAMGLSPHQWVIKRRIALAQRLMHNRNTPLSQIATNCGFADQSHLTRVFTRHVGTSPASWRRSVQ